MNKQLLLVATIAVLVVMITPLNDVDATKSYGKTRHQYGSDTKHIVCGDTLCSETQQSNKQRSQTESSRNIDSMSKEELLDIIKSTMKEEFERKIATLDKMTLHDLRQQFKMMKNSYPTEADIKQSNHDNLRYNKDLNPSQIEYENIIGFNDLHIEAIRHIEPEGDESKLKIVVHHHCKVYDDMTAVCLLFPTGMGDQAKPYGIEYVISTEMFQKLPDEEKPYWHYHLTEFPRAKASFPDITEQQLESLKPILDETYGKVFYFWNIDDEYPIGNPTVLVVQNLPE